MTLAMPKSKATLSTVYFCPLYFTLFVLFVVSYANGQGTFKTRSGRDIDLSYIRRYIQLNDESYLKRVLKHMIFEYDAKSNTLFSFHRKIELPDKSTRSRIRLRQYVDRAFRSDGENPVIYMSKSRNGDTFLFDAGKNYSILGASGDTIDIHSINHPDHEVYLNHYISATPERNQTGNFTKKKKCTKNYQLSITAVIDQDICSRFNDSKARSYYIIEQFVYQSKNMFMDLSCVEIKLVGIYSYCGRNHFNWNLPKCERTNSSQKVCSSSISRSKHIMKEMQKVSGYNLGTRELYMFISGSGTSSSLAGLAYKTRACDIRKSNIWLKGFSRFAFYHEIGHLLGANHVDKGIMQPKLKIQEGIGFSKKSQREINRFIDKDPRSWCLRRKLSYPSQLSTKGWTKIKFRILNSTEIRDPDFDSISVAPRLNSTKTDLIVLISAPGRSLFDPYDIIEEKRKMKKRLFYGYVRDIGGISRSSSVQEINCKSLGVEFRPSELIIGNDYFEFNLRTFTRSPSNSRAVLLSYIKSDASTTEYGIWVPRYQVAAVKTNNDIDKKSWTAPQLIGGFNTIVDSAYGSMKTSMDIGNIRSRQSVDVVHLQLDSPREIVRKSLLRYKIGFNLSSTGIVQSGWSNYFRVPGEFYMTHSISVSIMDVDGNGRPDLVIYSEEQNSYTSPYSYTYIIVGKDLSRKGIVTGGWTDNKMIPGEFGRANYNSENSMTTADSLRPGRTTILIADRYWGRKNKVVHVSYSHTALSKDFLGTAKTYSRIEAVTDKCDICYVDTSAKRCKDTLNLCRSQFDELQIFQYLPSRRKPHTTKAVYRKYNESSANNEQISGKSARGSIKMTHENVLKKKSIYCVGFDHFVSRDPCDTIDGKSVYSKGLEIIFTDYLKETISEEDIDSTSLMEDGFGASGPNGEPIIAQINIRGKRKPTKEKINRALRKAYENEKKIPSFKKLTGKELFKVKSRRWNEGKKVWVVKFQFLQSINEVY